MTAHTGLVMCVCSSVCFELGNWWADYDEIWFGHFMAFQSKNRRKNISYFLSVAFSFLPFTLSLFFFLPFLCLIFSTFDFNKAFYFVFQMSFLVLKLFINVKYGCKF
jgi:hypothetical protein